MQSEFESFSKVILDESESKNREKALNYKAFRHKKDLASKPQWFGLQGLFTLGCYGDKLGVAQANSQETESLPLIVLFSNSKFRIF